MGKNFTFSFCFSLAYSYLWLRRKYFRSGKQRKTSFPLVFRSLIRTFAVVNRVTQAFVWLSRIHRCRGFGIQSPTDYSFVRDVVNEQRPYYAYGEVGLADDWLRRKLGLLYLRLANYMQPDIISDLAGYADYLSAGCRKASIVNDLTPPTSHLTPLTSHLSPHTSLIIAHSDDVTPTLLSQCGEKTMLVVEDICHHKELWHEVEQWPTVTVAFDLYYCGIATFNSQRAKQHYIVNF